MGFSAELRSRAKVVPNANSCVVVIDDDPEVLESLGRLLRSVGLHTCLFASIADFLGSEPPDSPTCLVLDVRLPGRSGLDFQSDLAAAGVRLPIIFITGHGDIPMTVQAMKAGAIEFLTKPFREQDFLEAVNLGLARDRARRENEVTLSALRARFEELTPRERAILILGRAGPVEQADCLRYGHHRNHGEGASEQHDAQDQRHIGRRSLPNSGQVEPAAGELRALVSSGERNNYRRSVRATMARRGWRVSTRDRFW